MRETSAVRPWIALLFVLAPSGARGDSSVGTPAIRLPGQCTKDDAPYCRALRETLRIDHDKKRRLVHFTPRRLLLQEIPNENTRDAHLRHWVLDRVMPPTIWEIFGEPHALVEDAAGDLVGTLLSTSGLHKNGALSFRDERTQATRWQVPWPGRARFRGGAATLLVGDQLIIAHFSRTDTGVGLFSVDVRTGATRFVAAPAQLNFRDQPSFNSVTLERSGDTIVMRGYEDRRLSSSIPWIE